MFPTNYKNPSLRKFPNATNIVFSSFGLCHGSCAGPAVMQTRRISWHLDNGYESCFYSNANLVTESWRKPRRWWQASPPRWIWSSSSANILPQDFSSDINLRLGSNNMWLPSKKRFFTWIELASGRSRRRRPLSDSSRAVDALDLKQRQNWSVEIAIAC